MYGNNNYVHVAGAYLDARTDDLVPPVDPVRELDVAHIRRIKQNLLASTARATSLLLVNINVKEVKDVDTEKLAAGGTYPLEVIGGNHRRAALKEVIAQSEHRDDRRYVTH